MNDFSHSLLTNRGLLAINQDPLGRQGFRPGWNGHAGDRQETWVKPLSDGSVAVGLFNLSERNTHRINASWDSMGLAERRTALVTDAMTGRELGEFTRSFSTMVGPHDCAVLRVAPRS
jgi:alpha-galactosidase